MRQQYMQHGDAMVWLLMSTTIQMVLMDVHHKHPAWVTRTSCYEHDDVQYGTAEMMLSPRTHHGDTANTFTWQ